MKSRWIRLIVSLLAVVLGTKFLLVGSEVQNVGSLDKNKSQFRAFDVSASVLKKWAEENTEDRWIRLIAINFCKQGGKLKEGQEQLTENSLYAMMIPSEIILQYHEKLRILLRDVKMFPVPKDETGGETTSFENSWGGKRAYGGERSHEGCDIMTSNNEAGYFPVQSMCDGVVEKIGWLNLGGYRIGIRSPSGVFFYYAHMDQYAEGLEVGSEVKAGQTLGRMGNTGYGEEGTVGKFDTHLHVGIYMDVCGEEVSVNPYQILRFVEGYRKIM